MEEAEGEKGGRGWMESMFAVENFSQIKKKGEGLEEEEELR